MLKQIDNLRVRISYHILPLSIIAILCVIMIASWFRYGLLYGGGDVGLPTYNPIRIFFIAKNIWWDVHAPGFPYPSALSAIPLYLFLSLFQVLGFSPVAIQLVLFTPLLFLTGAGMYLLFFEVSNSKNRNLAFVAAIFYMLNPYMVTQIWHRFVHTSFFLAALIPILTYVYIKIVNTRRFIWLLTFLALTFIFTYTFGTLAYMIVIWIPLIAYSVWLSFQKREVFKNIQIFVLVFVSWIVVNLWWLYPFWTTGPALFVRIHSLYGSISTLLTLSDQSSMPSVLRGINPFYTFGEDAWVSGYDNVLMQFISWTFPLIVLLGIYYILSGKKKNYYLWVLLFIGGVVISKGAAAPFGNLLVLLFGKSFLLGAFRNPFEKAGIIIPFASAFIFPLGIEKIYHWLKLKFSGNYIPARLIICSLLLLEFVIYPWPMWLGKIFGSKDQSALVKIPDDYKNADLWITNERKTGRILHLPFTNGDAVTYKWERGYNGIEPSPLLFQVPSVSNIFGLEQIDYSLNAINTVFTNEYFDQQKIASVLSNLGIRYVVLHKDVDWKSRGLTDPNIVEKVLNEVDFIKRKENFGNLVIYEIDDKYVLPKVFTHSVPEVLTGGEKGFSYWPTIFKDTSWPVLFTTPVIDDSRWLSLLENANYSVVPSHIIDISSGPLAYKENALLELPRPRFLPGSPLYFLILIKEKITLMSSPILNRHLMKLDFAGKRLYEISLLRRKGETGLAGSLRDVYSKQIEDALTEIDQKNKSGLINTGDLLLLKTIFERHQIVLQELGEEKLLENNRLELSKIGFMPYYELKEENGMSKYGRKVFRFDVTRGDEYNILIENKDSRGIYQNGLKSITLQVNDKIQTFQTVVRGDYLLLGGIRLEVGLNEISYNTIDSVNLVPDTGNVKLQFEGTVNTFVNDGTVTYELLTDRLNGTKLSFPITEFYHDSLYRIDFEYGVKSGEGPILQVEQSSDWEVNGERFMDINKQYYKGNSNIEWIFASMLFKPRSNTNEATIRFVVKPWNNKESHVEIKNITVKRIFTNDIILQSRSLIAEEKKLTPVQITQLSPSFYKGTLTLNEPTSLVFLTTFHPEWKLYLSKDKSTEIVSEANHLLVNGYGNLWYLDKEPGNYDIKIEFTPQKRFYRGIVMSALGSLTIIILGLIFLNKKRDD